jgi:RHS repeat-associated protein
VSASAGPPDVSIDSNGNLTQRVEGSDTWTYEWTAENQLKRVLKNAVEQARFAYDPMGRRVEKVAGGVTTTYTYDGADILRRQAGGSAFLYIHGEETDEPFAVEDGTGTLSYFHADGLGSVAKVTNTAGAVTSSFRYDAFGRIEAGSPSTYAFTGREWDSETGLYYYRARYYDPVLGRFLSEDPIAFVGGLNFYTYVGANPASFADPLGLCAVPPGMTECLQQVFKGEPVHKVKVVHKPKESSFAADTRWSTIRVFVDCDAFWKDCETVLEEYFHVLKQWRKKRLFWVRYLANSAAKWMLPNQHRYKDNKYEKEAQRYAKDHCDDLEDCLKCGDE